ncbi:ATP synthase complex assembly protein ATP12 KNAG_0C02310 [Huiozyma naganishii CBS 8797]|uniref:ATP synthase mitochondrial F1 complex assembly factor 2 n=1 Tax=Huiozyma naganishii (strain ATCC MYA-139 / BCRC 22969 / CBS 8797 / KCTC 17520 / NBRC 10181 / NCYC 3082 / Yp74L-3) TaxID=1071383 RepID=J7RWG1_HUIN7|nr:hypothetical protein KNAG_0C02310 [Kazachstania naganishii CBS 8797]CCK69342.1 hypothetical protein KNAG_0C02310 [Kazachstania naganishii CBS 8797]
MNSGVSTLCRNVGRFGGARYRLLAKRHLGNFETPRFIRSYAVPPTSPNNTSPLGADNTVENNLQTETNRLDKTGTKFWKDVSLNESIEPGKTHIQLDSKSIRTPMGNSLAVSKSNQFLACLLRKEWANLPDLSVKPYSLPLTSLVSRCIDLEVSNAVNAAPDLVVKIGGDRHTINKDLLRYLDTDTLLVFSPRDEFEGALREEQDTLYLPIIKAVEQFLTDNFSKKTVHLKILDADVHGIASNMQSADCVESATKYLNSLSPWNLALFEKTVLTTKSFICGILLIENKTNPVHQKNLTYSLDEIERAATLEIIYQTDRWGEVEDTHDVNKHDIKRNLAAVAVAAYKKTNP